MVQNLPLSAGGEDGSAGMREGLEGDRQMVGRSTVDCWIGD